MNQVKHWLTPDWPLPDHIHAATTLRTGGYSQPPFSSLNMADHVGDEPEKVQKNRQVVKKLLILPNDPVWLQQVHGNKVVYAQKTDHQLVADASYTDQAGIVCAVLTADCLPILVCSTDGKKIAAIHAGWRGLLSGVISNTLAVFNTQDALIWLGPAIGEDSFEVGSEVRSLFLAKSSDFFDAFKQHQTDKWLLDIYQLARIELSQLGYCKIYGGGFCTFRDQDRFYSYRRDQLTGRMATLIWRD